MAARGATLRQIYEHPDANAELFNVAEALVDYDQNLQSWRMRHLLIVYRQIGVGTPSLKGKPSDLLAEGMKHRFFEKLWKRARRAVRGVDTHASVRRRQGLPRLKRSLAGGSPAC